MYLVFLQESIITLGIYFQCSLNPSSHKGEFIAEFQVIGCTVQDKHTVYILFIVQKSVSLTYKLRYSELKVLGLFFKKPL